MITQMDGFAPQPGRLMDLVRETLRYYHYAYSTEKNYIQWILRYIRYIRYIRFHYCRLPQETGAGD